jgi:hypothetical protein
MNTNKENKEKRVVKEKNKMQKKSFQMHPLRPCGFFLCFRKLKQSETEHTRGGQPPPWGGSATPFFFLLFFYFFLFFKKGGGSTPLGHGVVRPPPDRPVWGVAEPPPWPKGWPATPNGVHGDGSATPVIFFFFFFYNYRFNF